MKMYTLEIYSNGKYVPVLQSESIVELWNARENDYKGTFWSILDDKGTPLKLIEIMDLRLKELDALT